MTKRTHQGQPGWRPAALALIAAVMSGTAVAQSEALLQSQPGVKELRMAALGDSITRAFNANGPVDHPWNSWATGNSDKVGLFRRGQVKSHAEFLSDLTGRDVLVHNVAKSGATSADLKRQVKLLKGIHLDYATLLIGANNLCGHGASATTSGNADMSAFASEVEDAVTALIRMNPGIKILLVSIPDMPRLQRLGKGTQCESRWNSFGICKMLLGKSATGETIETFTRQWQEANRDLSEIAARHSDHVLYNPTLSEFPFERQHVSELDCFHPNITGQNLLSLETWKTGWWGE